MQVRRIRFVDATQAGATIRREFTDPRRCFAVEDTIALADVPDGVWPEPTDVLHVVVIAKAEAADWQKAGGAWLKPPSHPDAPPTVSFEREGLTVEWRPGRAVVRGRADRWDDALAGLTDFAFYEGELRKLEEGLETGRVDSAADAKIAYRLQSRDKARWARFGEKIEYFTQLRLTFARLEPRLSKSTRRLPLQARRVMSRLLARADVEDRLEALNDGMETCEELYEAANDRVADHRWWAIGHRTELAIVVFLVLEFFVTAAELCLHLKDFYMD